MTNTSSFWETWSPYLVYLEDNHLDLRTINALTKMICDPVLVVGAGQGLLVEELRKKGFRVDGVDSCSEMIKFAEQRRGLKLVQTDGKTLPFADESYNTSIIATGVIDFLDNEKQIRQIIQETNRVTQRSGKLLISFYKVHPAAERFLRRIGVITDNGTMRHRRVFELSKQDPKSFISAVRKDGNLGIIGALFELARMHFSLPRQERIISKNLAKILKSADNPDELIGAVSESIPYRNLERVQALFKKLDMPVTEIMVFDPCLVVDLDIKS